MKSKTIFEAMKANVAKTLEGMPLDLLGVSDGESVNEETGVISTFQRFEVEVPKGFEELSRCRFTVKVPEGKVKLTEKDLNEDYFRVTFSGIEVSYVSDRGLVYFRAADAVVTKEG